MSSGPLAADRSGSPGARLLIALAVGGGAVFAAVAVLASSSAVVADLDRASILGFRTVNSPGAIAGPEWLGPLMRDVTALGGAPVMTLLTVALVGYLIVRRRWAAIGLLVAVVVGQALAVDALKGLFDRPRPDLVPPLASVSSRSFPSGHASSSASVFLLLALMLAPSLPNRAARHYVLACAIALALLVGMSRVALGVHYPTDVLAGWSFGVSWTATLLLVARRIAAG